MFRSDRSRSYLVECYWPGVSAEKLAAAAERAQKAAAHLRSRGRELHFRGSILVPVDETVFYLFDGDEEFYLFDGDEADVRAVSEYSGVPFERILKSLPIHGQEEE
jgi:hypothetical protein